MKAAFSRRWLALLLALGVPAGAVEPADRSALEKLSRTFRDAYKEVAPAVVLVRTTPSHRQLRRLLPQSHPDLPGGPQDRERFRGLGSGTIVSDDGYILSNYHVIQGAESIRVTLSDRRSFGAEVVGFDSLIDIALLKVDARELPVASLGSSDELEIGDWVLAIGHPLGLGSTLTHGIVSALGRAARVIRAEYSIKSFIQTNAVINPGNSGGPLLNLSGEVVGINTAISTRTGWYMGYGLAVPIALAQEAMADILEHGRVVRGYLGISMEQVNQTLVDDMHLAMSTPHGVHVNKTLPGTPAERSELTEGDVILRVDGIPVDRPNEVQTLIYARDPGDVVGLSVLRDSSTLQIQVVLGEQEEDRLLAEGHRRVDALGMTVEVLSYERAGQIGFTDEIAAQLGFSEDEAVVVVVDVDPAGLAATKDIRVSDVITEVDDRRIDSFDTFFRSVSQLEVGESALFWLWRPQRGIDVRALRIAEEE